MKPSVAILHYSAPPVVGGVESVIQAHARLLTEAGYPTNVVAGKGAQESLTQGAAFISVPEMDSQFPAIVEISRETEQGRMPENFETMTARLEENLLPVLHHADIVIVHNVFTKHFNLPLTTALVRLLDKEEIHRCIAWCHDFTWTSPNSRSKVFPGYPWDLLRTPRADVTYVTISKARQRELAGLYSFPSEQIRVVYNGVHPDELLGISQTGMNLIDRLGLWDSDLNLLMPLRVTQAKNIELAIRVTAALKERGLRVKLIVTGPPDPHDPKNMAYFQSLQDLRRQMDVVDEMRFVFESGPNPSEPFTVDMPVVGDLFRVSDALFMPSHREGFGMPIPEAAFAGLRIFCAETIPAAREIGGEDVVAFSPGEDPGRVADLIFDWTQRDPVHQLRRQARQNLTWRGVFQREILPLLDGEV